MGFSRHIVLKKRMFIALQECALSDARHSLLKKM